MNSNDGFLILPQRLHRRYGLTLAFVLISAAVIAIGAYVVSDLRHANQEARRMSSGLMSELDLIGELQYQTQEARRSMLYALTTTDSDLQVEYADRSRAADNYASRMVEEHMKRTALPHVR